MVRSEIISKLSEKIHRKLKKSDLEKVLNILIDAIIEGIKNNRSTEIRSFGRFSVKKFSTLQVLWGRIRNSGSSIAVKLSKKI